MNQSWSPEPWTGKYARDELRRDICVTVRDWDRACACVDALRGIPDPAKFREAFDGMLRAWSACESGLHVDCTCAGRDTCGACQMRRSVARARSVLNEEPAP